MKMNKWIAPVCMAFVLIMLSGCSKVSAGYVGVKVFLLGGAKGVDTQELGVGRYWIGFNEELHLFPTFAQNYVWTKASTEGSRNDEAFSFQTKEGMVVGADIGITYAINPNMVSNIFQKYRKGVDEITNVYIRNMVRDALVTQASTRAVEDVYGMGKTALMKAVEKQVKDQCTPIGIDVEKIYWVGDLRLPPTIVASINAKIEATQKTSRRENEIAQVTAEARKVEEAAKGEATAISLVAIAEAEAIELKGKALNKYPLIVQLNSIEKWNGELPSVTSGAIPFINVDSLGK